MQHGGERRGLATWLNLPVWTSVFLAGLLWAAGSPLLPRVAADAPLTRIGATILENGTVLIEWETVKETGVAAFRLYRATALEGPWEELLDEQAAIGSPESGASYAVNDVNVEPGAIYYYLLEEVLAGDAGVYRYSDDIISAAVEAPRPPDEASTTPSPTAAAPARATALPSSGPTSTSQPILRVTPSGRTGGSAPTQAPRGSRLPLVLGGSLVLLAAILGAVVVRIGLRGRH